MIRLARPDINDADLDAVAQVLRSGMLVQGARVADLERTIAQLTRMPHAAAVSNGTAALHLALLAAGIGRGDHVAVPTFSWPATANAVVLCGAQPVFVDVERSTMGMSPDALRDVAARHRNLKAVVPVHAFGRMARMSELIAIAESHGLMVIEDAACALGATLHGRAAGAWGSLGTFSFHPRKAATTGEGGAIVCTRADHLRRVRMLRNHGLDPDSATPDFVEAGFNLRMTEFQAALGLTQLARYDTLLASRRRLAAYYDASLRRLPLDLPDAGPEGAHVYQAYVVLLSDENAARRESIIAGMRSRGIETAIGTYHLPLLSYFRRTLGHRAGDHPVSESIARRALALPLHPGLQRSELELVAEALGEELRR